MSKKQPSLEQGKQSRSFTGGQDTDTMVPSVKVRTLNNLICGIRILVILFDSAM